MKRVVEICLLWIFLNVVSGRERRSITDNSLEKVLSETNNRNGHLLTKLLSSQYQKRLTEDLDRYLAEKKRQINQEDVELADERKTQETLEEVLEARAVLERKLNSALSDWLSTKIRRLDEKEKDRRGWGNGELPHVN
ncbi:uncharacterized protein LOC123536728 [Mercenaria mercenaria]|uniref:uncharacterized protein LOC123536728 n=1 Tax=Mercenaria mercenaria TaxID=6596 RepID=UPI00234E92F1|nr:uncharacterized protein LOC123536728 [Mercenaria mercenaria]